MDGLFCNYVSLCLAHTGMPIFHILFELLYNLYNLIDDQLLALHQKSILTQTLYSLNRM